MTTRSSVKGSGSNPRHRQSHAERGRGRLVGVIASNADLRAAIGMGQPPDLFELRLDCLRHILNEVEAKLPMLRAPIIITARHPREGGANNLPIRDRRDLLARFLPHAQFVDIELRSLPALRPLFDLARRKNIQRIISLHDLNSTPAVRTLRAKARRAKKSGASIFKLATRTDTPGELARLIDFFENKDAGLSVSGMGIGKFGAASRLLLARSGSALNYASLGPSRIEGQLAMEQLRSVLSAPKSTRQEGSKREKRGKSFT
jgi:3-dehydroquinate dehydratase-1